MTAKTVPPRALASLIAPLILLSVGDARAQGEILDHFETLDGWSAITAPGARVTLSRDAGYSGAGMRVDFDFSAGGSYIILHRELQATLPDDYAFSFRLRGEAPANTLEFKLLDEASGSVWWRSQRDYDFPADWRRVSIRRNQITFAFGPDNTPLRRIGAVEIAIARGTGGSGTLWLDDLRFEERRSTGDPNAMPAVTATSALPDRSPQTIFDGDPLTSWHSTNDESQSLTLDFSAPREYGGLAIDWDHDDFAVRYEVQVSNDGAGWETAYTMFAGNGGRDFVPLPDGESRFLRLRLKQSSRGEGYALRGIAVKPYDFSATPNQFFAAIAREAPRGALPRYFSDEQSYWTVVGAPGDAREGLLSEDGVVEVDLGGYSIEPYLHRRGQLVTWADARVGQALERDHLPIPTVTWQADPITLAVTAFADGNDGAANLYVRYRIGNAGNLPERVTLFLAVRPFQVNPPWQSLNTSGGVSRIEDLNYDGRLLLVNNRDAVWPLAPPDRFGAATFDQFPVLDLLHDNRLPDEARVHDDTGYATAVMAYDLELPAGGEREIYIAIPPGGTANADPGDVGDPAWLKIPGPAHFNQAVAQWAGIADRVGLRIPATHRPLLDTLRSTLAYILINRDGAALQPGSRCYARSWIRDGALTGSALLAFGFSAEVRDFIRWYARAQNYDGGIPCCVDGRGTDPVVEHDSHGQFIYLLAEYWRYTGDLAFVRQLWPQITRTVEHVEALRRQRMTPEYQTDGRQAYFGMLPESISHEGYAAHPVHAYWDAFWTLRGLKDAADLAAAIDDPEHAGPYAALRDAFRADLLASMERTMAAHRLDYLPASVELGDFDPSAIAIAISPVGELERLPAEPLRRTFEVFHDYFIGRREGSIEWGAYAPYELRIPSALLHMGERDKAWELLDYYLRDRRPLAWNQWPEIVWRDARAPRFLGDLPHTWIGSDFIRLTRDLFVIERESDRALVLGAGLPPEWLATGSGVQALPTHHGLLTYDVRHGGDHEVIWTIEGEIAMPPGGIELRSPVAAPIRTATINGRDLVVAHADRLRIDEIPARVVIYY